jgi:hypothetical protein
LLIDGHQVDKSFIHILVGFSFLPTNIALTPHRRVLSVNLYRAIARNFIEQARNEKLRIKNYSQ